MFNSIVLEVVIGLVFIFLLYSLLATTVCELIASALGLRAKNLTRAIRRMLDDSPVKRKNVFNDLLELSNAFIYRVTFFLSYFLPFIKDAGLLLKDKKLSDKFYENPKIKYLSATYAYSKPSYISGNNFADALTDLLQGAASSDSGMATIEKNLTDNLLGIDKETHTQVLSYFKQSAGDIEKFKAYLEKWFDETMERITGWYKRKTQLMIFCIGWIIAISFNVDTIEIVKNLSKDPKAGEQFAAMANEMISNPKSKEFFQVSGKDSLRVDSVLYSNYKKLDSLANKSNEIMGMGWNLNRGDSVNILMATDENKFNNLKKVVKSKDFKMDKQGLVVSGDAAICAVLDGKFRPPLKMDTTKFDSLNRIKVYGTINYSFLGKVWYVISESFSSWRRILGFLLTTLALSLGAPFWFDLLSKFVQIRGTGIKMGTSAADNRKTKTGGKE